MSGINFARCSGLTYVHTPFAHIRHADRPIEEWAAAWETLFNLGEGELACEANTRKVVSYPQNSASLALCLGWDHRGDEIQQSFHGMIPEFRRKYYLNKSPRTNQEVIVAVHVRRGWDVPANHYLFASADSILRTITLVKIALDAHGIQHRINVYSEGSCVDFAEICIPGVELSKYRVGNYPDARSNDVPELSLPSGESVLDIDAISAMREMIEADVLIMSKSSFSYCAAVISDGIKIFDPERQLIDDWLLRSEDGSFDCAAFDRQLSLLIQAKAARK